MASSVEIESPTCPNESIVSELRSHGSGFDAQACPSEQGTGGIAGFVIIFDLKRGGHVWGICGLWRVRVPLYIL